MSTRAIIFSRDRPLQLDACLRSLRLHCAEKSIGVRVLYKATTGDFAAAYREVADAYPWAVLVPDGDFEADVRNLLVARDHVLFIVDDSIFVRPFSVREMVTALAAEPEAIGFSLRLGRNCVTSYPSGGRSQAEPRFYQDGDMLGWHWPGADGDWGYPLEVSSSLYRTADILALVRAVPRGNIRNPNTLEYALSIESDRDVIAGREMPHLLCAPLSLAFSVPCNKVQTVFANRAGTDPRLSADALLRTWQEGWRIDVAALAGYTPSACHEEIALPLMKAPRCGAAYSYEHRNLLGGPGRKFVGECSLPIGHESAHLGEEKT